jgi:endonuclease YncB( thermonuclease family)
MARRLPVVLAALLAFGSLQGCNAEGEPFDFAQGEPTPYATAVPRPTIYATLTLPPTWTLRPPTPTNTRVIQPTPTFTPGPSPTPTRLPVRVKALVVGIQDGHTIEVLIDGQPVSQGFTVRLLGIEPPLLSDPWARVSIEWLTEEVSRQIVVLESDEVERDTQGNLLRYVWREGLMINVTMAQLGLATTSEDVADLRFGTDLLDAQADAKAAECGLWGPPPTSTPTPITATATLTTTQTPTITLTTTQTPTATLTATQTPTVTLTATQTPTVTLTTTQTPTASPP